MIDMIIGTGTGMAIAAVGYICGRLSLIEQLRSETREKQLEHALTAVVEAVMRNGLEMHPVMPGEPDTFEILMEALQHAREIVKR